jgi:hypothetical protein
MSASLLRVIAEGSLSDCAQARPFRLVVSTSRQIDESAQNHGAIGRTKASLNDQATELYLFAGVALAFL